MKRMSRLDAAFWFAETRECPMHGTGLRICDPSGVPNFSFEAVRAVIAARVEELPALRYRVVGSRLGLDRPWLVEDPDFDIGMHVRRIALPPPGGRRELEEVVGRLMSRHLNRARPLWEKWFIEGLDHGRVATVTKIHHALVDGVSGAALIERMYDPGPLPRTPVPEAGPPPVEDQGIPRLELRALGALVNVVAVTPYRMLRVVGQTVSQQVAVRELTNRPPRFFQAPKTRFNAAISPRRQFSSARVSLDRANAVRQAFGVMFNDVLLALVSGALRRYLQERGELPERPLVAQMLVSTRGDRTELGNLITTVPVGLPTDVADPVERMKTTAVNARGAKDMAGVLSAHRAVGRTEVTPPGLLQLGARAYAAIHLGSRLPPINLAVSNTRGPDAPYYLAGAVVERVVGMGPIVLEVALNITCYTYNGGADIGFTTTPEIACDIDQLADGIEPALQELEEAAARLVASSS